MVRNPFSVSSPEIMNAAEMLRLYVPLSENFEIDSPGHVFVHGHRGCGKSMMLRQMSPDCLTQSTGKIFSDLPYLGLYATIKSTALDISDFERLNNQYAGIILAEHSLSLFIASKALQSLRDHTCNYLDNDVCSSSLFDFCKKFIVGALRSVGANEGSFDCFPSQPTKSVETLTASISIIDDVYEVLADYLRNVGINQTYIPYSGPIVSYRNFLYPLLCAINQFDGMPVGKPVYLLLDDADNLSAVQTQILNTWVSFRTGDKVSFKISTQRGYKTWRTSTRQRIESPHDFKEVDISTIYTGRHSRTAYPRWVADIIGRRLVECGIDKSAQEFFPPDERQESAIRQLGEKRKEQWKEEGRGARPGDDAYRYARPDYIKGLGAKQMRTYSYAGYDQLVHISSGIIRYFLDNAAAMYGEEMKLRSVTPSEQQPVVLDHISPSIQDQVVRDSADNLFFGELDDLERDACDENGGITVHSFRKLRNLIKAIGGIFQAILLSDRSERRVFAIALSDTPTDEIMGILELGVRHGYLYEGTIGTKDGRWRTRRFVFTRRLAPIFKLDPTGFSGYLFVTSELLEMAVKNPSRAVAGFESGRLGKVLDNNQLPLDF